ncbi:MAG TPA: PAS-domain containing protein, partial [Acetobacteraceae bacterium]|nr:PAS-domain containing protein [Acetobacteraceae bacterium]
MQGTRPLRRLILAVTAVILAMQGIATWQLVERAREARLAAAEETVGRIARAMESAANRAFIQVDAMLAGLPPVLATVVRDGQVSTADVNRVLRELNNQNLTYRDILLLGPDGTPLAAAQALSRRRPPPVLRGAVFHDLGASGGAVSFAGPFLNPATGEWSLFLARGITVIGLGPVRAVAEVPVHQIQALFTGGAEGAGLRMTLEREDGTLLASIPHDARRMGQRLDPPAARLRQDSPVEITSRLGDQPVLIAVRQTLYPTLFVSASIETDQALAQWRQHRWQAFLLSGSIAVLLLLVALALVEWLQSRDRLEAERTGAQRRLEAAIESMSDGFVMFDAEDRLVVCNSRYREFYQVSAPFIVPGARFEDIMREGARRGQYVNVGKDLEAWVRDLTAWHRGDHPPMERLLPDGRWLRITERRMPDGGTVGIRSDITPMKQAMAALSAAREDAARAAEAKGRFLARMSHELRTPL